MKKFDLKGVLSNLRGGDKPSKPENDVQEVLTSHDFVYSKLLRQGFPFGPTCLAWDPVQKLVAIGTKHGEVRLLGRPGVEKTLQHENKCAVFNVVFLINEGGLLTVCSDDSVNLWNYRQQQPEIVNTLQFSRERVTYVHLPFQSKWLYLGTERGNVHIVNVETFTLCGYVINWNKAIELGRKTHPGPVVHLSDNPLDPSKLLIGFETGLVVCWDLKNKMAEYRYKSQESLRDCCWHTEGKLFMCSHADGTITTWNFRQQQKPVSITSPHARHGQHGGQHSTACKPINRLEWKTVKNKEPYVIFNGGMPIESSSKAKPTLTIMNGSSVVVMEMEYSIVDFIALSNSIFPYECNDPYAIIILLSKDLVFVDLTSSGYPLIPCPYAMDLHNSPVTCLKYYSDCAAELIAAYYSCGKKQKRKTASNKNFPVTGGQWGDVTCSYHELLITGHYDGSIKFWEVSGVDVQFLYRIRTSKYFEKSSSIDVAAASSADGPGSDSLAIQHIYLDEKSRRLIVSASQHVILFNYSKKDANIEVPLLWVTTANDVFEEVHTGDDNLFSPPQPQSSQSAPPNQVRNVPLPPYCSYNLSDLTSALKPKSDMAKYSAGYQPQLLTVLRWCEGTAQVPMITCISFNSCYDIMAIGTTTSIVIIDTVQQICLINALPAELFTSHLSRPTVSATNSVPMSPRLPLSHANSGEDGSGRSDQQQSCEEDSQLLSPQDENKNNLLVRQNSQSHIRRCRSTSTPAALALVNTPAPHTSDTSIDLLPPPSLTVPKLSSELSSNTQHQSVLPPKNMVDPNPEVSVSNHNPLDTSSQKQSWKRRISIKVGLSTKSKAAANVKSQTAVPGSINSEGFFPDQQHPPANKASSMLAPCSRFKPDKGEGVITGSRSSSMNSLESASHEIVRFFMFAEGYTTKQEQGKSKWSRVARAALANSRSKDNMAHSLNSQPMSTASPAAGWGRVSTGTASASPLSSMPYDSKPGLWIGTNNGSVIPMNIFVPVSDRDSQQVIITHSGWTLSLKGVILNLSLTDFSGMLVTPEAEMWTEKTTDITEKKDKRGCLTKMQSFAAPTPPSSMSLSSHCSESAPATTISARTRRDKFRSSHSVSLTVTTDSLDGDISVGAVSHRPKSPDLSSMRRLVSRFGRSSTSESSDRLTDKHIAVICSEYDIRCVSLPSQHVRSKEKVCENTRLLKAKTITFKESSCLVCLDSNFSLQVYSLPSLRTLYTCNNFMSLPQEISVKTLEFGNHGHAIYMRSPSEVEKVSLSASISQEQTDMQCQVFIARDTPEPPKQSFLKNLFGSGPSSLDRQELFGSSGKASHGIAVRVNRDTLTSAQANTSTVAGEVNRARIALDERGEKLGQLEIRSEALRERAREFSANAAMLANKQSSSKWYHL